MRVVDSIEEAVEHIRTYSSGHTEAICTPSLKAAHFFRSNVDSAAVAINASTRFTDGGQLGLGAEIGISTQKLHARGPMGLAELKVKGGEYANSGRGLGKNPTLNRDHGRHL